MESKFWNMEGTAEHFSLQNQFPTGQLLKLSSPFFLMQPTWSVVRKIGKHITYIERENSNWRNKWINLTFTLALITIQYCLLSKLLTVRIEFTHATSSTSTGWTKPFSLGHTLQKEDDNTSLEDEICKLYTCINKQKTIQYIGY